MAGNAAGRSGTVGKPWALQPPANWMRVLARIGYAAKGVVYLLIGLLAAQAALGGGAPEGSEGALRTLELQPLGRVALGLTAAGLGAYVLWRIAAAVFNPEGDGVRKRIAHLFAALVYIGIAAEAVRIILTSGGGGSDREPAHWTARALSLPLGPWLVVAGAMAIGGYGLYQLYKAWTVEFDKNLDLAALRRSPRCAVIAIGRTAVAARGIAFLAVAWFLLVAALQSDPGEARGLAGALRTLQGERYGRILLGAAAAGLFAYGLHQFVIARLRRAGG